MRDDRGFDSAEFGDSPRLPPRAPRPPAPAPEPTAERWWTLREAAAATGVPVETLRRWYRRGRITGRLIETPAGSRIQVRAVDVIDRRRSPSDPAPTSRGADDNGLPAPPPVRPEPPMTPAPTHVASPAEPSPPPGPVASPPEPVPADGDGVLVPVDTWQRILSQLGNLHEAGQQLAEARERAARAETEAAFLRERLAELRNRTSPPEPVASAADEATPAATAAATPPVSSSPYAPAPSTAAGRAVDQAVVSIRQAWQRRRQR